MKASTCGGNPAVGVRPRLFWGAERSGLTPLLIIAAISGCAAADPQPRPQPPADYVACRDPRPQICTREYLPVCAQVDTGKRCVTTPCDSSVQETRASGCSACSDPKVMGYRKGAC